MKLKRFLVAGGAFVPLVYSLLFVGIILPNLLDDVRTDRVDADPHGFVRRIVVIAIIHFSIMAIAIAVLVYFLVILNRQPVHQVQNRVLWAIALILGNVIVFPIFYWRFIRRPPQMIT